MINRFVSALQPMSNAVCILKDNNVQKCNDLITNKKKYKLREKDIKLYNEHETLPPNKLFIICVASCQNKNKCRIKVNVKQQIATIIKSLQSIFDSDANLSFLQVKNYIFADSNFFEELNTYVFKKSNEELSALTLYPSLDIYFFDGKSNNYTIKINKILYDNDEDFTVLEYFTRNILCKVCNKNVSTVNVLDNPILPQNDRFLCKICFDELFVNDNGEIRYKDMKYENIK